MDPDQTAHVGAVWSGSTIFATVLMLNRHFQMQLFCWRFLKGLNNVFCVYTEIIAQDDNVTFE